MYVKHRVSRGFNLGALSPRQGRVLVSLRGRIYIYIYIERERERDR